MTENRVAGMRSDPVATILSHRYRRMLESAANARLAGRSARLAEAVAHRRNRD